MKKAGILVLLLSAIACNSSRKISESKPLYEILTSQEDGGATIRFFEILSEEREIKMLQNDDKIKNKITTIDTKTANFVILNMGEKTTAGYSIKVQRIEETPTTIVITTQDNEPTSKLVEEREIFYYPYTIVKINSKKEIIVK
jgi:hypothetical protein